MKDRGIVRVLSAILVVALMAGVTPAYAATAATAAGETEASARTAMFAATDAIAAAAAPTFVDVPEGHWAYEAAEYLYENRIMSGVGDGLLGINRPLSRAEMAVLYVRVNKIDVENVQPDPPPQIADIDLAEWAAPSINYVVDADWMELDGEGRFNPFTWSKREEIMGLLVSLVDDYDENADYLGALDAFADAGDIDKKFRSATAYMVTHNLVGPGADGMFLPDGLMLRGEFAVILYQIMTDGALAPWALQAAATMNRAYNTNRFSASEELLSTGAAQDLVSEALGYPGADINGFSKSDIFTSPESDNITRAELAALLYALYRLPDRGPSDFTDCGDLPDLHKSAVDSLRGLQMISGTGEGVFSPGAAVTNAYAAVLFHAVWSDPRHKNEIFAPKETSSKSYVVSGKTLLPGETVEVYVNGALYGGPVKTNMRGSWLREIIIPDSTVTGDAFEVYARIGSMQTERATTLYDPNFKAVETVEILVEPNRQTMLLDFQGNTTYEPYYTVVIGQNLHMTFTVKFTASSSLDDIGNVYVVTTDMYGAETRIQAFFDESLVAYIGVHEYPYDAAWTGDHASGDGAPVAVRVEYPDESEGEPVDIEAVVAPLRQTDEQYYGAMEALAGGLPSELLNEQEKADYSAGISELSRYFDEVGREGDMYGHEPLPDDIAWDEAMNKFRELYGYTDEELADAGFDATAYVETLIDDNNIEESELTELYSWMEDATALKDIYDDTADGTQFPSESVETLGAFETLKAFETADMPCDAAAEYEYQEFSANYLDSPISPLAVDSSSLDAEIAKAEALIATLKGINAATDFAERLTNLEEEFEDFVPDKYESLADFNKEQLREALMKNERCADIIEKLDAVNETAGEIYAEVIEEVKKKWDEMVEPASESLGDYFEEAVKAFEGSRPMRNPLVRGAFNIGKEVVGFLAGYADIAASVWAETAVFEERVAAIKAARDALLACCGGNCPDPVGLLENAMMNLEYALAEENRVYGRNIDNLLIWTALTDATGVDKLKPLMLCIESLKNVTDIWVELTDERRFAQVIGEAYENLNACIVFCMESKTIDKAVTSILDPSGYVYEAVPSNVVEGVTVTVYYQDGNSETQFDAEQYDQKNPLTTDGGGRYAWDVPDGLWRVKAEKGGYEPAQSDWVKVPPPQTEVNIPIVSHEAPTVVSSAASQESADIEFSKYMDINTLNSASISLGGQSFKIEFPDAESDNKGNVYARTVRLAPNDGQQFEGNLALNVTTAVKSYAGVAMTAAYNRTFTVSTPGGDTDNGGGDTGGNNTGGNNTGGGGSPGGGSGGGGAPAVTTATISVTKASFDKSDGKDISLTLNGAGYALTAVKNGTYTLKRGTDYALSGSSVSIKKEYLASLDAGTVTITFDMSGGADPKLTVTVIGDEPSDASDGEADLDGGDRSELPKPITPTMPVNPFTDILGTDWYIDDVIYVFANGLMNGTSTEPMLFSPNEPVTRGMIVTILYRYAGEPDVSDIENAFSDADSEQWYSDAVKWAAKNGIVQGVGAGLFAPDASVTRQDLAVILLRYMEHAGINPDPAPGQTQFTDEADIADYAKSAIRTLNSLGIINGIGNGAIDPAGEATRAQVAAMLRRFSTIEP